VNSHVSHYEARVVANGENEALVIARDITQKKHEEEVRRRGLLLKEIHHRVKNNLQVVSGLLYLQSTRMSDKKVIEMFNESSNRIQSMSLIHQKLYQSQDAITVDFDGYVRDLIGALLHSYGVDNNAVMVNLKIGRRGLGMDSAIPCGLIINELVSNSLKHAFPAGKKGEINIAMSRDSGDGITLVVADNGIGFPQGLDFLNAESLGLQLVATLVGQLDATISLNRNSGTEFTIKFKEAKPVVPVGIQQEQYEHSGT
jgi:two-component sensor histidine kinase